MNQFGLRTHSIWHTQKCCPKRRVFVVAGVYSNVTCIIYVLGAEGHSGYSECWGNVHGSGFKKQGMQNSHGLHLKDKILQGLRRKRPLQNRFPGVGRPLEEGWKTTALNAASRPQPQEL